MTYSSERSSETASSATAARRAHSAASSARPSSSSTAARAPNSAGLQEKARSGSSSGMSSSPSAASFWPRSRRAPDIAMARATRTSTGNDARSTARPSSSARSGRPTPRSLSTMSAIWSSRPEMRRKVRNSRSARAKSPVAYAVMATVSRTSAIRPARWLAASACSWASVGSSSTRRAAIARWRATASAFSLERVFSSLRAAAGRS